MKTLWNYMTLLPRQIARSPVYAIHFFGLLAGWSTTWIFAFLACFYFLRSDGESFQTCIGTAVLGLLFWRVFDITSISVLVRSWTHPSYIPTSIPKRPKLLQFFEPVEVRALQRITGIPDRTEAFALIEKHMAGIGGSPQFASLQKTSAIFSWILILTVPLLILRILISPYYPLTFEELFPGFVVLTCVVLFLVFLARILDGLSERIARVALITILETDPRPIGEKIVQLRELGFDLQATPEQNKGIA